MPGVPTPSRAAAAAAPRARVLDPIDRTSEILFGVIMLLTFTGSLSVATSGRQEIREMVVAALGCNLAWGLVDGAMYLLAAVVEHGRRAWIRRRLAGLDADAARALAREAMPEWLAPSVEDAVLDRAVAAARGGAEDRTRLLRGEDARGAVGVFLIVTLATFPVVLPFIVIQDVTLALRVSNSVALALLFGAGVRLGRAAGLRPVATGVAMALAGAVLAAVAIALGG